MARALEDEEFRRLLKTDPKTAVQDELSRLLGHGVALPDGIRVHAHEESASDFHFVIPADDLESSSGAGDPDSEDLLLFWERILRPAE